MRRIPLYAWFLVTVLPMVWLVLNSLRSSREIFLEPFGWPAGIRWENYLGAWTVARFGDYFLNSLVVTVISVLGVVLLGSMAAYGLARFVFPGAQAVLFFFLGGMMVPLQLAVVPLFFEMGWLGLLNSRVGLVLVYVASGLPFAIFILVGFFRSLPTELYESAVIDGCSPWRAFWSIMLPLAQPGLITVAVFTFLGTWNEYFLAFMLLSGRGSEAVRTLPLGLANLTIVSQYRTDYGMLFAGLVLVMLPTLVVYAVLQRYVTRGVTMGALK